MLTKIRLLPDHIANKIAAGEVVQGPSFALKELLENAVDAGSTLIKVFIKDEGKTLIRVCDNGQGMNEVDARMCFERHATSKIKTVQDLNAIETLGFRGEALASMAAVAQISLTTRDANEELGTHILLAGSILDKQTPVTAPIGTTVSIKNLFFNVPVRRKFLKSPSIEKKHIIDEFQRIALANPSIAFQLQMNDTQVYQLPAQKLAQRIVHIFGKNYQTKLVPCQASTKLINIHGYIAPPKEAKKTRGGQFFFVNHRYIKSSYLQHAVKKAFEGLLAPNAFPFYILYINLPSSHIDVNVHPAKTEVKFQEEGLIYGIVKTAIQQALANYHITPALDIEQGEGYNTLFNPTSAEQEERNYTLFKTISIEKKIPSPFSTPLIKPKEQLVEDLQYPLVSSSDTPQPLLNKIQLHNKYIVAQVKSGMLLVERYLAQERIVYEQILAQAKRKTINTQQLLLPQSVRLQPSDLVLLQACKKELQKIGFQFTTQPPTVLTVTGVPPAINYSSVQSLFEELLEQYKCYEAAFTLPNKEKWARAMAKRMRPNQEKQLDALAIASLIERLFACENPNYTPDGKRIWTILTLEKLSSLLEV